MQLFFNQLSTKSLNYFYTPKILYLSDWILRFLNGSNKVVTELRTRTVQLRSEIILAIWNYTYAAHSFNVEITRMISNQTALHPSSITIINPLNLKSDQLLISPYNITSESNIKVTRIKEMITNQKSSWLSNKFSLSAP